MATGLGRLPRGRSDGAGTSVTEADRNGWGEAIGKAWREPFQEVFCSSLCQALCKVTMCLGLPRTVSVHACRPGVSVCPKGVRIWMTNGIITV